MPNARRGIQVEGSLEDFFLTLGRIDRIHSQTWLSISQCEISGLVWAKNHYANGTGRIRNAFTGPTGSGHSLRVRPASLEGLGGL
jgi:hypothetical protein